MASVPLPEQNFILGGDPLSLERIRAILTRLEDTIIFSLIERAQFAHNPKAYRRGEIKELKEIGFTGSWLEWFLKETESFHGEPPRCPSRLEIRPCADWGGGACAGSSTSRAQRRQGDTPGASHFHYPVCIRPCKKQGKKNN